MITSSRRRAIRISVTRCFESNRLQTQSIASAYDALIPVVNARPRRPHLRAGDPQISSTRIDDYRPSAVGA
jgi:hypothetical protein